MELRQIRYFLAIQEHGSFSRAAEACGVTQPALTKAIKAFEEQVGGQVFHREGRRLILSELGRMVQPHFARLVSEEDAALTVAKNFRLLRQTPLRLGILPTIGPVRIGRFLSAFRENHPGVEVAVSERPNASLRRDLEAGELDVVLANPASGFDDTFRSTALYRERYVVVLPPGHALEHHDALPLSALDGQDYVDRLACEMRELVMDVVSSRSIRLYAKFRSEREDWVQTMVLAGLGFAFMPEYSVTVGGLISRPLIDPAVGRDVHAFDVRGRTRTPAAELFLRDLTAYRWPG